MLADSVVIELGGVGLQVYVPAPLHDSLHRGESIFLHTYLVVREDALTLFGFESLEGREFFQLLLTVNGVGPRLALAVLSTMAPDAIRRAVFHEQAEVFSRVPGVGKKTAQKILLQLQDKITPDIGLEPVGAMGDTDSEVLEALTGLGYSVVEAQAAIQSIPHDTPQDVETRLRLALQFFSG
jgi:Holliday junction DNA helicase RuvA